MIEYDDVLTLADARKITSTICYTGCIISFSLSGNDIENLDEITNSIDIFITLDIVIVV